MTPFYDADGITIYHGDCREWSGTVDAIVTDPPYGRAALPLWDALATVAEASLRPAGWMLAYSGQACLPEVFGALSVPDLGYRWTLSSRYEGGGQIVSVGEMAVLSEWKPIVAYRRRPFGPSRGSDGKFVGGDRFELRDVLRRGGRDKSLHPWAQPTPEACELVAAFSEPDDVVLDPFMGSGTTLRAAKDLGRRAVGIELDERYCHVAAERLSQQVLDLGSTA